MEWPTIQEVMKGDVPMILWHYVGVASISPFKVNAERLQLAGKNMSDKDRTIMMSHGNAVITTAMIINKMMGRPLTAGSEGPEFEGN